MVETAEFLSRSPEETARLGARLAACLRAGDVVALTGVIGSGKSVMARAIAGALGIDVGMASPSFVIAASYEGAGDGPDVNHVDLYRLHDYGEALAAGVEDAIHSGAVSIVEWADHVPEDLWAVRASVVGAIGLELMAAGLTLDEASAEPLYVRPSEAERKRARGGRREI